MQHLETDRETLLTIYGTVAQQQELARANGERLQAINVLIQPPRPAPLVRQVSQSSRSPSLAIADDAA